jgi:uncharacterized protein YhaN
VKIQGWFVERFGAFRNYDVRDLPGGVTVFYGPNGAGKSTLLAFLRRMLFGGPRPEAGAAETALQHENGAGRVYCAGPRGGLHTIGRTSYQPARLHVTCPDGQEGGDAELDALFGGADGRLVGALLAFDVNDLRGLPLLGPSLHQRIFPPRPGNGFKALQQAQQTIQSRLSEIATRSGGDIQNLLTIPGDLQARLTSARGAAARHCQLLQARTHIDANRHVQAIADLKAEKSRYDALVDLWPLWQELTRARLELDGTESFERVPADPERRLEEALAAREAAQRTIDQLIDLHRPAPGDPRPETFPASTEATAGGPAMAGSSTEPVQSTGAHTAPEIDWGTVPPRRGDRLHASTEDLVSWQRRLTDVVEAVRDRQREVEVTRRAVRDLELARSEISVTLSRPEPPSAAVLDEEARLLQHVRDTITGIDKDQTSTKQWQDLIAERTSAVRTLETQVVRVPSAVVVPFALVAATIGLALAGWRYVEADAAGAAALIIFAFVSALVGAMQRSRRARALERASSRRARLLDARAEVEQACQSLLHHQERTARRRFDISVDSVRLGLPSMPTEHQLREREAELEEQRRLRAERDGARVALAQAAEAHEQQEELQRQQMQALIAAQAHGRETIQQWHQWKLRTGVTDSGFPASGGSGRSVQTLEHAQGSLEGLKGSAVAGLATPDPSAPVSTVETGPATRPEYERSPAVLAARRRLGQCEESLAQLFAEFGVADEAACRRRLASFRRRRELEQAVRSCEVRTDERLKQEPAAAAIKRELSEGQFDEWRRRAARTASELASLEASREESVRQQRQLAAETEAAAAASADLPALEVEQEACAKEGAEAVRRWRTLAVAASLVAETECEVERESQSPVLRRASEVLATITFSRYTRVLPSEDRRELLVQDAAGERWSVDQLSRATIHQLFFSLRLGLAEEHARSGPALPVILDDVLDNFDPKRGRAMAHQVVELARRHQVLVFTSRPETCDLLRNLNPETHVVTMQEL